MTSSSAKTRTPRLTVSGVATLAAALAWSCSRPAANPEVTRFVDEVLAHMEQRSVRRDSIDWPRMRAQMHAWARGARTTVDYYPALGRAIRMLGDNHSFHMPPQRTQQMQTSGGTASNPAIVVERMANDIGYIELPGYLGFDTDKGNVYATEVHAKLRAVDTPETCRWIVDLRRNGGGNMWPMLAAIGPILGDGLAGKFVSGRDQSNWGYEGNGPWAGTINNRRYFANPPYRPRHPPIVAVLTAPETGSSGEAIAVAFRGRENTRSFGRPTAGLTTGNSSIRLSDGSMLLLATTRYADRLGNVYRGALLPNEVIDAPRVNDLNADPTVAAAARWLAGQRCE